MAGVDESIVREYFEMNGFLVRQMRKYQVISRAKRDEEQIDLLVFNPTFAEGARKPNFLLFSSELPFVHRAVVAVKAWHSQKLTPSTLRGSSDIFKFLEKDVLKQADTLFASGAADEAREEIGHFTKILVIPSLPSHEPHKSQSIEMLRDAGVDGIVTFRSMLQDIIGKVEINHSYTKSDILQVLRILKNYDLLKSPQMELFGAGKGKL